MQKHNVKFGQYLNDYRDLGKEHREGFHLYLDSMRWGQVLPAAIETLLLSVASLFMNIVRNSVFIGWLHVRLLSIAFFIFSSVVFIVIVAMVEKIRPKSYVMKKQITIAFWIINIVNSLICTASFAFYSPEKEVIDFAIATAIFMLTIAFYSLMRSAYTFITLIAYSSILDFYVAKSSRITELHFYILVILIIGLIAAATRYVPMHMIYSEKLQVETVNGRLKNVAKEAVKKADEANSTKVDFLARISHDMRTPMNGILGLVHLSLQEEIPEVLRDNLKKMELTGNYLLNLINDMLDLRKLEEGNITLKKEPIRTVDFINNLSASLRPSIQEKNIDFKVVQENVSDCYMNIDRMRLQQVFMNIISNAVKFTPEGGAITVTVKDAGHENKHAHMEVTVQDTGVGMSKEFQEHLFEPFTQEDNGIANYAGAGLGMAIVKMLVETMQGSISVESTRGEGTTFFVNFDVELIDGPVAEEEKREAEVNYLQGRKILICEDNPLNKEIAKKMLEIKGAVAETAENGSIGLDMVAKSEMGYYSMVLMDVRMPVMNGLEATKAIRALNREDTQKMPIIAMSANAFKEDVDASISAGMNAHLTKPIVVKEFYNTIQKAIKEYEDK